MELRPQYGNVRIGVDLDGVVASYHNLLAWEISKHLKRRVTTKDIDGWNGGSLDLPDGFIDDVVDGHIKDGAFGRLEPIPLAKEALHSFNNSGAEIYFITARPDKAYAQTKEWLSKHKFKHEQLVFCEDKKRVAEYLKLHVHIDDRIKHCDEISKTDTLPLLYNQPWNKKDDKHYRVHSWMEVLALTNHLYDLRTRDDDSTKSYKQERQRNRETFQGR